MEEPTKPIASTNTVAPSPEQEDTARRIRKLLGKSIADQYRDFCLLAAGAVGLRTPRPHAAHALRELDSTLRHVLAAALDVEVETTEEDETRLLKAREALEACGFDRGRIETALKRLKPFSHKAQIKMIVERLGLDQDGDVAQKWVTVTEAAGKAHERSRFSRMKWRPSGWNCSKKWHPTQGPLR
jgi:hypothetical protein